MSHRHRFGQVKICPCCGNETFTQEELKEKSIKSVKRMITIDHILPKCRYTSESYYLFAFLSVRNTQPLCHKCNTSRGGYNHCLPAMIFDRMIKTEKPRINRKIPLIFG